MIDEATNKYSSCHIPITKIVASEILDAPTIYLNKLDKPYCSNSFTILSYLKTQTINIDIDIIICDNTKIFSISMFL